MVYSGIALTCASGRRRFALPDESEYFRIHFVFERRTYSMRISGIDFEHRALDDLGRQKR